MYFKRIADLRTDHDYTQVDVAKILNCHVGTYKRYESGVREIPISMLMVLAKHYGVSVDYIVENTDDPSPV